MAALDPFDMLVRLGKITQANLQAADLVETAAGTSTRAARLVAIGVDKQKLLEALSDLTRMPIASPEVLASLAPMKLPASYSRTMKELLAVPIGRVDDDILDVAIADPRTTTKLRDAAIAHRPHLALEGDILAALARMFPETDVLDPLSEPTLRNLPVMPRPVSVNDAAPIVAPIIVPNVPPLVAPMVSASREAIDGGPMLVGADDLSPLTSDDLEPPILDEAASVSGPKPFMLTGAMNEVTERVRTRASPLETSEESSSPPEETGTAHTFAERARGIVARVSARTLSIIALAAVIVAVAVLAIIVSSGPDADVVADAGVEGVVRDAGELESTPTPAVIEKPNPPPKPPRKKKPPRRTQKKKPPLKPR